MAATQASSHLLAVGTQHAFDDERAPANVRALLGRWHVIAASLGSISRNPRNVTEAFELSGTQLVSTLSFERLSGSVSAERRRVFQTSTNGDDGLWTLIQTSLDVVFVDEHHAIVAEGRRLRILSRLPEISPRDFFLHAVRLREQGYVVDDLRMIPSRQA